MGILSLHRTHTHKGTEHTEKFSLGARGAPRDPAPPAAWPRWGCGGGGKRRRINPTKDPDVKTYRYALISVLRTLVLELSKRKVLDAEEFATIVQQTAIAHRETGDPNDLADAKRSSR